ncbi:MAG TPA: HlyD family type I secretion periplasmic adaptor subunit [Humidesulfovibrio sp.]|uniref:HlyD family type I secretion periplasmic adaptor subunit n=1 Tax=Humidesulfovibrio sp. TaxID=2910988 RepID=UPI002C59D074|nr:HlyD family type I secretion periplasmic adaptor subunit [Humidesulfovibrio sp.]HWR04390.1 HlyD family type I secretion periplasmic adaptor subunit [Humidesulfovibrio sp.]
MTRKTYAESTERLDKAFAAKEATPRDFLPGLLRVEEAPPSPLGRTVLRVLLGLLALLLIWSIAGSLDIVAVAEGKLVPQSFLKIVQPAESGIVKEILVREGQHVVAGQVLMRMDSVGSDADVKSLAAELARKRITLRRIDSELEGTPFEQQADDPAGLFQEIRARLDSNKAALAAALAEERSVMEKAKRELMAAREVRIKLSETLPQYRAQEEAHAKLAKEGYAPLLQAGDKRRERVEKEQELRTQTQLIESAKASVTQSERKQEQLQAEYRKNLHAERNEAQGQLEKLEQELAKQTHRQDLLELKASQSGTVKDLSTHTIGTVTQPGTVLLTLVPDEEKLKAEVWVSNQDRGFVHAGQRVRLKFAAFPFQKYGMVDGRVEHVSADASDPDASSGQQSQSKTAKSAPLSFRALVTLDAMQLDFDGERLPLSSGLQTNAEILVGKRSVLEYLLSPVRKAVHEAGRER